VRERLFGALLGMAATALVFAALHYQFGWLAAGGVLAFIGWMVGGYIRHLHRVAERDALTGICNRRPFERILVREWNRSVRYGRPVSLLFIDVDDFGSVNKQFGHLMGDETLKVLARLLRHSVRNIDVVARWGGEEFVILLPETEVSAALVLAERIRRVVEQTVVRDGDRAVSVTISTGVAGYPGTARHVRELLRQAMLAEAEAKHRKNAVSIVS